MRTLAIVAADNDSERKLIFRIEPDYPEVLRARFIGGRVHLQVTIAPNGRVQDVVVLGGDAVLGQAAATAVAQWKYAAARSPTTTEVAITFDPHGTVFKIRH